MSDLSPDISTREPSDLRSVVITGLGLVSALGDTPEECHRSLSDGCRGTTQIRGFDTAGLPVREAAEIDFDPTHYLQGRNLRPIDRTGRLVIAAAQLALENSGWDDEMRRSHEAGLVLGTMFGSVHTISCFDRRALEAGPQYVKPFDFANSVINAAAGQTAIWHGLRGINSTITGGTTASLQALAYATDLIRSGRSSAILAGGGEELCFESLLGFARAGLLADRAASSIPFSAGRKGLILGEGAALLMLEDASFARSRGARTMAEILGYGTAFDPSRGRDAGRAIDTLTRAIEQALEQAGCHPSDIACISTGANGNPAGDLREAQAIARIFTGTSLPPITAVKGGLGECLGASAALQTLTLIEASRQRSLPGIAGFDRIDEEIPLSGLGSKPIALDRMPNILGLVTCFGLEGQAGALILETPGTS